jgi:outer membrane usher protein
MALHVPLGQGIAPTASAGLVVPIGRAGTASVSTSHSRREGARRRLQYSRSAPLDGGLGWRVAMGDSTIDSRAELTVRTSSVQLQAGVQAHRDQPTYWAGATGAAVVLGTRVFATTQAPDAFVLVDTNGHPGVPVLFENQRVGATDRRGYFLIPSVASHHAGKVSIDPLGLPPDVRVPLVETRVAVRQHSGAVVRFALERTSAAMVQLVDRAGHWLPVGARVAHPQTGRVLPMGWNGLVYLDHVAADNDLVVTLPDRSQCRVLFSAPSGAQSPTHIGPLTCLP